MPAAVRIAETSFANALIAGSSLGQLRSGEVQPCQLTMVELPNEALFIQPPVEEGAALAAFRSAKNELACFDATVNELTLLCATPERFCITAVPRPSEPTLILYPVVLVEPELTIVACSVLVAAQAATAAIAATNPTPAATPAANRART
jgi:hypothetical protein